MPLKRPTNRTRAEIQRLAQQAIQTHGGGDLARVFYKFDCGACGARCEAPEPNVLPETGICEVCGAETRILGAGYALHLRRDPHVPWDEPALLIRKRYDSDKGDA
jgi:hypothetical protein